MYYRAFGEKITLKKCKAPPYYHKRRHYCKKAHFFKPYRIGVLSTFISLLFVLVFVYRSLLFYSIHNIVYRIRLTSFLISIKIITGGIFIPYYNTGDNTPGKEALPWVTTKTPPPKTRIPPTKTCTIGHAPTLCKG